VDVTTRWDLAARLAGDQESLNAFYETMVKTAFSKWIVPA